ncbi:MAG: DUF2334 domain-containing protein [Candidatus Nanopelagicales bacterium]|nr:DUF2334 domain-containing protein [Candidatus Nanopelagicales bacterium]
MPLTWIRLATVAALIMSFVAGGPAPGNPAPPNTTLVVYDTSGPWGEHGQLYAQLVGNLTSRFGEHDALPATEYQADQMTSYKAVIYIGSSNDEPLPVAFLDDVLAGGTPVLWLGANLPQLHDRAAVDAIPGYFIHQYGWQYRAYDFRPVPSVTYKGRSLSRDSGHNAGGIMDVIIDEHSTRAHVLATANAGDGSSFPWAVRSGSLTYVGELPLSYTSESDRYLILADLLFDLLAPQTAERHRAMVRMEDVSPVTKPDDVRRLTDLMYQRGVPFSVAVIPVFVDPTSGSRIALSERPDLVAALKYAVQRGATVVQHGFTHQLGTQPNPYTGITAEDFEFFTAHVNQATNDVVLTGAVPADSEQWALERMAAGGASIVDAGLPAPAVFEFPHYAASEVDYDAAASRYTARYERALYFAGDSDTIFQGQFFPYEVIDRHGSRIIPENLGNVNLASYNNHPVTRPTDLIDRAARNLVVRDGFASFFFHHFLDPALLAETIDGIQALGYHFVSPAEVLASFPGRPVNPPSAPLDVRVDPKSTSAVVRVTTDPADDAPAQAFLYALDDGQSWVEAPANPDGSFLVSGLSPGSTHGLTVAAVNVVGRGPAFGPVTFSLTSPPATQQPPRRPGRLRVRATTKAVRATWRPVMSAERYRVRIRAGDKRRGHIVRRPSVSTRMSFPQGARVTVCVRSINSAGKSPTRCSTVRARAHRI